MSLRPSGDAASSVARLASALETVGSAAFVVNDEGAVLQSNLAGQELLDRDPAGIAAELRAAVEGGRTRFGIFRLQAKGAPNGFLAVKSEESLEERVLAAASRWRLTPRQQEVLALLVRGKCNKTIAAELGCAERTVELHVTACLEKAGCEQRSELVATVWKDL